MKRDEVRWEYSTNLGQKCRIPGTRSYMVETRGSEKERPDEVSCDAPHGRPFGGERHRPIFYRSSGGNKET